jgi:hypothetical protein
MDIDTLRYLHPAGRRKVERSEGIHDRGPESQGQRHASGKSDSDCRLNGTGADRLQTKLDGVLKVSLRLWPPGTKLMKQSAKAKL